MNYLKSVLNSYLNVGVFPHNRPDRNHKALMVNLLGLVGMFLCFGFGTILQDHAVLTLILYCLGFCYLGIHILQRYTGNKNLYVQLLLYSILIFMLYLVYSGGVNNHGPLWIYLVSPVALFLDGLKRGLINIGIFISIMCFMLFTPNDLLLATTYTSDFKVGLLFSFLSVTVLFAYYEHSRQRSFEFMNKISRKFEQMAKYDLLTQLPNRKEALDKLEYEYRRIERNLSPVSLILCDVDHFRRVNDKYGHEQGDKVIVTLGNLFKNIIRKQDTIARWGGEEFMFILPQTNSTQALIVAQKIKDKLAQHQDDFGIKKLTITVSMGVSEVNINTPIDVAIRRADEYLRKAKEGGRNQFQPQPVVFQSETISADSRFTHA
ncbi:GGDEF domain-containing protein [Alteromonas sp. a30]|uniref:GGDEF domain-containing protein n=1 Tax=Alteromonas sp. a30 TaxID=2730917 RepID=UPI002282B108|nr:GGDEF domain-containing protein [Alteromonas sp. a30]MCY7295133.1 GGDEF domain-containing protein [Alteromonas sp. a30]